MEKVTQEEYLAAKEAPDKTAADWEIINRAAEVGIKATEVAPEPTPDQETEVEQVSTDEVGETENQMDSAIQAEREIRERMERDQLARENELKAEIEKLQNGVKETPTVDTTKPNIVDELKNLNPDDFESEYEMMQYKQDKLIEALGEQSSLDPRLENALEKVEGYEQEQQRKETERQKEESAKAFRSEMQKLWDTAPEMNPGVTYDTAEREYSTFLSKVASEFSLDEKGVDKMFAQLNDDHLSESTRNMIEAKDIKIPDTFGQVYKSLVAYDFMEGYGTDPHTGAKFKIRTTTGEVQKLSDIESAYLLMNKNKFLEQTRKQVALDTQKQLDMVRGPNVIPTDRIDPVQTSDAMTVEKAAPILAEFKRDKDAFLRDPVKKAQLHEVYRLLEIKV